MRKPFNNDVINNITATEAAKQSNPKWVNLFRIYFAFLSRSLYNMYCWDNLPDSMDERFLEMCLMQDGVAGLMDHPNYGHVNMRATWGEIGIYGIPIRSEFYTINDSLRSQVYVGKDSDNAVLILNNAEGQGYVWYAVEYARRMADIAISHGINVDAQRTPFLIDGDFQQLEQITKAYMMYAGGSSVIPTRTSNNKKQNLGSELNKLQLFQTIAPFVADKLYSQFISILHEFYGLVGINFANNAKQERMIVDEVNANNQEILLSGMAGLNTRRLAAEQYNKIHGTNIKVHISVDPVSEKPHNYKETWEESKNNEQERNELGEFQ